MGDGQSRLVDAARSLNQTLDPSRLLVRVCEQAVRVAQAERADVFFSRQGDGFRMEATYGRAGESIGAPGEGIVRAVADAGEPVSDSSAVAVPLTWDEELRGVLVVEGGQEDARDLLETFADLAAAACRNASAHAGLALAARTDGLTGCLNHAALQDTLRRELERCRRSGRVLSLAIVDLDEFKQVNEEHGHLAGDEVLRRVGGALRDSVRSYDVVARYGGDEFAIIAIDAGEPIAVEVAERALEGIRRALDELGRAGATTGATAGVAESLPEDSPTMLIARADEALLEGKQRGGRGTVVGASGRR